MKGNTYKCHLTLLILSTGDSNQIQIENSDSLIKSKLCENHLGVQFYYQLTFDQHVKSLCKKANAKVKVFAWVVLFVGMAKKKLKINSFFAAQFNYYLLIWMTHIHFKKQQSWKCIVSFVIKTFKHLQLKCLR